MIRQATTQTPIPTQAGGPGASPVSSHPAARAARPGERPWTTRRRDTLNSEIVDAGGNVFLIDTHAVVSGIAQLVDEAGL